MIDYKEMEKVIQNLNLYVEKMQKISDSQQKMSEFVEELNRIKENIGLVEVSLNKYTKSIEELESKHETIKSQIDTVLQDYKKLHSTFELLDIRLKKINVQNECFEKSITELKSLTIEIQKEVASIKTTQKAIFNQQSFLAKSNRTWFRVITGLLGAILTVVIVGLLI
ncbi:MAG: hypothetical protein IKI95_01910 [Clostridia bacterium]|nr:hypothetical protein [Clostridia bacterium]